MAKRISEEQKKEIIKDFLNNKTLEEISGKFNFTKSTITRNLKKNLGEDKYHEIINLPRFDKELPKLNNSLKEEPDIFNDSVENLKEEPFLVNEFLEIAPLDFEIDKNPQKDLSSVAITEVELPKLVYMVVDKQIDLETKLLKNYTEWSFLSEKDLNRKTIEIFFDLKIAKRSCKKEQKVIKVPNSNVFKIVAPILLSRGISRIVSSDYLIAL